ncbi:MAG TPA: GntR family transcriptional regulator [Candidatus Nanopelagicales bacterium]|nr:GntR family transcriptional regulator [Candidatus Nanopelagicales bacterium]
MARYDEIANDLRRRILEGEFGGPGDRIPTLSELMAEYEVAGVQTMRQAQAVLVEEGVLEPRHGSGTYIARLPAVGAVTLAVVHDELEQLQQALTRVRRHVASLSPIPDTASLAEAREWAWARWTRCGTCDFGDGGVSRGWIDAADPYLEDDPLDSCRDQGHDISQGIGLLPNNDPATAAAIEAWWEHHAQNEEAARLLLAGDDHAARRHASRARELSKQHGGFVGYSSPVTPPASVSG